MEKLPEIKEALVHGDYNTIHKMTGVSISSINKMMQGGRNINTPTGAKVLKAAKKIIKARQDLIQPKTPVSNPEESTISLPFNT